MKLLLGISAIAMLATSATGCNQADVVRARV